jgi:glycerophosphoryl diester phosphodiesterase
VELKRDPSGAGTLAARVTGLIREHGLAGRVIISSFHYANLRHVQALAPELPLALLYDPSEPWRVLQALLAPGVPAAAHHPYFGLLSRRVLGWYHARGLRVNTWTVNSERDLRRLMALGVDGVITNHPDLAARLRGERDDLAGASAPLGL